MHNYDKFFAMYITINLSSHLARILFTDYVNYNDVSCYLAT